MNYKGLKFDNTIDEFRRWDNEFKSIFSDQESNINYRDIGDNYYASARVVNDILNSDYKFIGVTIRKYCPEERDFNSISDKEKIEIYNSNIKFRNFLRRYKDKHEYASLLLPKGVIL